MNSDHEERVQLEMLSRDIQTASAFLPTILLFSVQFYIVSNLILCLGLTKISCFLQPPILEAKELASVNLWMNNAQARSSTHYDPHHNLLCIVSGRKQGKKMLYSLCCINFHPCSIEQSEILCSCFMASFC